MIWMSARTRRLLIAKLNANKAGDKVVEHYCTHIHKTRTYDARFTGSRWMNSILGSKTDTRCVNAFRMDRRTFNQLCHDLQQYGLNESPRIRIVEKVGIFVYTLA